MLNAIGLQNVGARKFLEEKLPFLRTLRTRCIVNVFGYSTEDYVRAIEILNAGDGIDAYELNISCPNTRCGGMVYGNDPKLTEEVVAASKRAARFPLFVKLSPNVTDITVLARAAEAAGADALTLVNTFVGMAIDIETRTPRVSNVTAGLSGPAIKPVALRMVYQVARAVKIPIVGIGGIATAEDALEYIIAGARAVQMFGEARDEALGRYLGGMVRCAAAFEQLAVDAAGVIERDHVAVMDAAVFDRL